MRNNLKRLANCLSLLLLIFVTARATQHVPDQWGFYGGDAGGARFSELKQINRRNVAQLKQAWVYRTGEVSLKGRNAYALRSDK